MITLFIMARTFEKKTGTSIIAALWNIHIISDCPSLFVIELGACKGQRRTNGQEPIKCPISIVTAA